MFYWLFYPLREIFFGFNIFRYITFRAMMAGITAFVLCLMLGPWFIRKLTRLKVGENIIGQETCPQLHSLHSAKAGIPTMGGGLILFSVVLATLLWARLDNTYILLSLFSLLYLGVVGFIDDYMKFTRSNRSQGMPARMKFLCQTVLALIVGIFAFRDPQIGQRLSVPFLKDMVINLGYFYLLFVTLVIVGSSNAVNLTDGLDGLAAGCIIMVAFAYSVLSYLSGHAGFSAYLQISYISQSAELAVFCAGIAGAALGFLWFNAYPAEIFMGDTGSLSLGGALGVVAVLIKKEMLLLLAGGIFAAECVSVILQVASFKLRKKRIFLVAPLHHHFQVGGVPESKVTIRFWIISAILAILALATLKLR